MKKAFTLLLVFCLILSLSSAAFAAGAPKIKKQPVSQTTDKGGNVTFEFEATGFTDVSWRFVNPETGEEWTGKQLADVITAKGFTISVANGRQKVKLTKVPEEMHGWDVYAVISNKSGYSVNTNVVKLWCFGLEQTSSAQAPVQQPEVTPEPASGQQQEQVPAGDPPVVEQIPEEGQSAAGQEEDPVPAGPKTITVTAENLTLIPVDSRGNLLEDEAAHSLSFVGSGNVAVRSETPVKYWIVNGMRIEPMDSVNGFVLKNVTSDLTISAKLDRGSAPAEEVDPDNMCQVTCEGCVFTYNGGNLRSVSSGSVPAGAQIIIMAASGSDVSKGFCVNGGEPEHKGSTSFRLKITEDTVITVP